MPSTTILGSGRYLPGRPVPNSALSRVMDTSDEWIRQRTGIGQRHFADDGVGASDLALHAAEQAIAAAGLVVTDIDYLLFNTMTPDSILPGSAALVAAKLGLVGVPALDLRQQCAAIPYSLQIADALIGAGLARHVLIIGAETHGSLMPWRRWDLLAEGATGMAEAEEFARATEHRGVSILFGDGAGAFVVGQGEPGAGLLASKVHSDGRGYDALRVPGVGFSKRPMLDGPRTDPAQHVPRMNGRELFKQAVVRLPQVVHEVCREHVGSLAEVDWFLAHQANDRINRAVQEALSLPEHKVPSNIARYGNTSSATIPILFDELVREGRLKRGQLVCFFALGAGLHWGAALMRL